MNLDIDNIRNQLSGLKIKLRDDLDKFVNKTLDGVYIAPEMGRKAGQIVEIDCIRYASDKKCLIFKHTQSSFNYNFSMVDLEYNGVNVDEIKKIIGLNKNTEQFKKGDLVKIKQIPDSINISADEKSVKGILTLIVLDKEIEKLKCLSQLANNEIVIYDIQDDIIFPYYIDGEYKNIIINKDCVEIVEENFIDNLRKKDELTINEEEKKILEDFDIIDEMIEKVDKKAYKKILTGSLAILPSNIKGIDINLFNWAYNKKEIYKLLGKELSVKKEIEFEKDETTMEAERQNLYRKFPGCYYVLRYISNSEFINNKLSHTMDDQWTYFARTYQSGTKVSKMIDEAFSNEKLNIALSDIFAKNKIKGFLEISINPIEYLLMSLNKSGWSSCHTLHKFGNKRSWGCFSAGIFSYMCDEVSLIAFRHDGRIYDYRISNQKIQQHSKNWRQMIWLAKDFKSFVASRQYPNYIPEIAKEIREMLEEKINQKDNVEHKWVHTSRRDNFEKYITDKKVETRIAPLHYNDILHGYDGDFAYIKETELKENSIVVGSYPVCSVCGKEIMYYEEYPVCGKCMDKINGGGF